MEQNLLLLLDQLNGTNGFGRGVRVFGQLFGGVAFLGADLADHGAAVVQGFDLPVQAGQSIPHTDDVQQGVGLVFIAGLHKAGQVQRQRLHKSVQQLLAAALAGGVGDGQAAVLALALDDDAVGQRHPQVGRADGTLPGRRGRAVLLAAQRPGDSVQHAGLALVVVAAHDGQPGGRGFDLHGLDALDILGLQRSDFYRHFRSSSWVFVRIFSN